MSTETLDGTLARIVYHKTAAWNPAGVPYLIGSLSTGATVKGEMRKPVEGEQYRFFGEFRPQKNRPGEQAFEFVAHEVIIDKSTSGIARYLAEYVAGIGPAKARAIVEHFGEDTLDILRKSPERLAEVESVSINEAIINATAKHFKEECKVDPIAYARLIEMFKDFRIPKTIIRDLVENFGSDTPEFIKENPYSLLAYPRIGWKTADSFALTKCGYDPTGLDRHKCAIEEALQRVADEGHTYGTQFDVLGQAVPLLGQAPRDDVWEALEAEQRIVRDMNESGETTYTLPPLHFAEISISDRIAELSAAATPLDYPLATDKLQGEQVDAAAILECHGVACLCGPPGTGKSFVAAQIINSIRENSASKIMYVAPTGKAAKRGAELLEKYVPGCGIKPSTIHRALAPTSSKDKEGIPQSSAKVGRGRDEFGFGRNEDNPLETDWIFIDETSMVDAKLMAALLRAIAPGTRVVFIGDQNQLPSVGPGSVLRDMLAAGVPTAMLCQIRRSDGGGSVVKACHAIKDGRIPIPAKSINLEIGDNWVHIERETPDEIAETIAALHKPGKTFADLYWDFQVVTPRNGRSVAFAVDAMNDLLSPRVNLVGSELGGYTVARDENEIGPPFRIGDKVVRTKNGDCDCLHLFVPDGPNSLRVDWTWDEQEWAIEEGYIVNGDMGVIRDIVDGYVVVQFNNPDQLCRLPMNGHYLIQAFAMTCHKCQGSGFPFVIVPVHDSVYSGLFTREWIYTAMSRTEKLLVTVGQFSAIELAVRRKTVDQRRTTLARRIMWTKEATPTQSRTSQQEHSQATMPTQAQQPMQRQRPHETRSHQLSA